MVQLSPAFVPAHLMGLAVHPENALKFDFLVHQGDGHLNPAQKQVEYTKLIKYFLASLTIPDQDQWVNLSPYEHHRIIPESFGQTEMGRDLLEQDYLLKQISSSLMFPESGLGKSFWDEIYKRAWKQFHTPQGPVKTFNKVWIVPDKTTVFVSQNTAYVVQSHLKVMLEEDYLATIKGTSPFILASPKVKKRETSPLLMQSMLRQIILPALEQEVNQGKNFAPLRQIVSSMVLATWYKKALKDSIIGRVYADKDKVSDLNTDRLTLNPQQIYQQYLKAFKKGVYSYIKEDQDKYSRQRVPRKYFAGGFARLGVESIINPAMSSADETLQAKRVIKGALNDLDETTVVMGPDLHLKADDAGMISPKNGSRIFSIILNFLIPLIVISGVVYLTNDFVAQLFQESRESREREQLGIEAEHFLTGGIISPELFHVPGIDNPNKVLTDLKVHKYVGDRYVAPDFNEDHFALPGHSLSELDLIKKVLVRFRGVPWDRDFLASHFKIQFEGNFGNNRTVVLALASWINKTLYAGMDSIGGDAKRTFERRFGSTVVFRINDVDQPLFLFQDLGAGYFIDLNPKIFEPANIPRLILGLVRAFRKIEATNQPSLGMDFTDTDQSAWSQLFMLFARHGIHYTHMYKYFYEAYALRGQNHMDPNTGWNKDASAGDDLRRAFEQKLHARQDFIIQQDESRAMSSSNQKGQIRDTLEPALPNADMAAVAVDPHSGQRIPIDVYLKAEEKIKPEMREFVILVSRFDISSLGFLSELNHKDGFYYTKGKWVYKGISALGNGLPRLTFADKADVWETIPEGHLHSVVLPDAQDFEGGMSLRQFMLLIKTKNPPRFSLILKNPPPAGIPFKRLYYKGVDAYLVGECDPIYLGGINQALKDPEVDAIYNPLRPRLDNIWERAQDGQHFRLKQDVMIHERQIRKLAGPHAEVVWDTISKARWLEEAGYTLTHGPLGTLDLDKSILYLKISNTPNAQPFALNNSDFLGFKFPLNASAAMIAAQNSDSAMIEASKIAGMRYVEFMKFVNLNPMMALESLRDRWSRLLESNRILADQVQNHRKAVHRLKIAIVYKAVQDYRRKPMELFFKIELSKYPHGLLARARSVTMENLNDWYRILEVEHGIYSMVIEYGFVPPIIRELQGDIKRAIAQRNLIGATQEAIKILAASSGKEYTKPDVSKASLLAWVPEKTYISNDRLITAVLKLQEARGKRYLIPDPSGSDPDPFTMAITTLRDEVLVKRFQISEFLGSKEAAEDYLKQQGINFAMSSQEHTGGIDLNAAHMGMSVTGQSGTLQISDQDAAQLSGLQGLHLRIISIKPAARQPILASLNI